MKRPTCTGPLTVDELADAEIEVIKVTQLEAFGKEISVLSSSNSKGIKLANSPLKKLNPVYISGVLRVGGRLRRSTEEFNIKHPVILPSSSHVTHLLIEQHHRKIGHCGMSHTWTSLRQTFWVLKGASTVRKILGQCLFCKRRNRKLGSQLMADLPEGRVTSNCPPFYFFRS